MNIQKIINNNVISAVNDKNEEVVVMGRGIGFKAHAGDAIDETKIEKVFRIENETISRQFQEILENIPLEHMQLTEEIISKAKEVLKVKLNQSIYVTLTDEEIVNDAMGILQSSVRKRAFGLRMRCFGRSKSFTETSTRSDNMRSNCLTRRLKPILQRMRLALLLFTL